MVEHALELKKRKSKEYKRLIPKIKLLGNKVAKESPEDIDLYLFVKEKSKNLK